MNGVEPAHIDLMKTLAQGLSDHSLVLKGNAALMLTYGTERKSAALSFDCSGQPDLRDSLRTILSGAGLDDFTIRLRKNTRRASRYLIQYQKGSTRQQLRIDVDHHKLLRRNDCHTVEGMKAYKPDALCRQALARCNHRRSATDLYDLGYLVEHHGDSITRKTARELEKFVARGEALSSRFLILFIRDPLMEYQVVETLLSKLAENVKNLGRDTSKER